MNTYNRIEYNRGNFESPMYNFYYGHYRETLIKLLYSSSDPQEIYSSIIYLLFNEENKEVYEDYIIKDIIAGLCLTYIYSKTDYLDISIISDALNASIDTISISTLLNKCYSYDVNPKFSDIVFKINKGDNIPETYEEMFALPAIRVKLARISSSLHDGNIVPYMNEIFRAFELVPLNEIKVIWLGQDPYYTFTTIENSEVPSAMGLCFSLRRGDPKINKSLNNIFSLAERTLNKTTSEGKLIRWIRPDHGDLTEWARQGILFLNVTLTNCSISRSPSMHENIWKGLVEHHILNYIISKTDNVIFVLLGRKAQDAIPRSARNNPKVETTHPSPMSAYRGFNDSNIFNDINDYLSEDKQINWFRI